ncbi:unnamed protein product [Lathyrus sativus]|nr:unnamed protein product [Lathyrus sativus]
MFMKEAQPRFKIPSRVTVARDYLCLYFDEKEKLKSMLSANKQMVSLTTDTWTSIQNMNNASANNLAIDYLNRGMSFWNGRTLFNGEYLHMRCSAHILNLIVKEGIKDIDESVKRIRAACKFVKASPSRLATFKKCAEAVGVCSKALVTLDVETRWNSTYLILNIAEKYEHAFYRLEHADVAFLTNLRIESKGCPNRADWERARIFVKFLKTFYDATLSFSGSLHVTANSFFKQLMDIKKNVE